ncbi:MAG: hypothetical protein ACE5E5_16885, partial [Phycisphaerae bacterium]
PPRPDLIRQPAGCFGWLEDRLLHDGWLARLGPEGTSVLVLLALAADRRGASFYGRERMADRLSMSRQEVDQALSRLLDLHLIAHRPWRQGHPDGIWQLLPLPQSSKRTPAAQAVSLGDLCRSLGFPHPDQPTHPPKPPDSRAS